MKSPANRDLYAYWNERRGNRVAPERGDIEPNAIRHVLGDSFFLSADQAAKFPFRLTGTRLCALFGRELKNDSFMNIWCEAQQLTMHNLINIVAEEKVGVVAQAIGRIANDSALLVNLEMLLLPLQKRGPLDARVLGTLVPMTVPFWFGVRTVAPLELGMMRHIGAALDQIPVPRLAPEPKVAMVVNENRADRTRLLPGGQIRHGFVVYEGGRTD